MRGTPVRNLLCAAVALWAAAASAATVDASLTGLLQGRPVVRAGEAQTFVPFFAQVGLNASGISLGKVEDVRVGLGAWGRVALVGQDTAGDVDLAYVSGKLLDKRLSLTLGRHFKTGGAVRALHLDGLTAEVALPARLSLMAFGGVPVIPRFAVGRGDAVWGARLAWRASWETEVGASYLELMDKGYTARRDVALDGRTQLMKKLVLTGLGVFSAAEGRLVEVDVSPRYRLSNKVELYGTFRHASPDLFLPRTSIFSVFADVARTEGALGVAYDPSLRFSASADARVIAIPAGTGYEAQALFALRPARNTRASFQVARLGLPANGYTRARLAGGHTVGKLTLTADLDAAFLDGPINGNRHSLQGMVAARLPLPSNLDLVVSGLAATDPLFQQRFEVMGRLVYTFSTRSSEAAK